MKELESLYSCHEHGFCYLSESCSGTFSLRSLSNLWPRTPRCHTERMYSRTLLWNDSVKQTLLHEQSVKEVYNLSLVFKESMIVGKKIFLQIS